MSHSTVCNRTVSTKKTRRTGELRKPVTCNAACVQGKRSCKREWEICVFASNQAWAWVWVCVCVCVTIKQISSIQLLMCVRVYNGSAPGSAIKKRPEMCVCLYTRKIKGRHGCVYVCLSSSASCVCMYAYVCYHRWTIATT